MHPLLKILVPAIVALNLGAAQAAGHGHRVNTPASVDIKGIHLGMSKAEFQALFPDAKLDDVDPLPHFTIGGTESKYGGGPGLEWEKDGTLGYFVFQYYPAGFDGLRTALKQKYPALKCQRSVVYNALGEAFDDEDCWLGRDLLLSKYTDDLTLGQLTLESDAHRKAERDEQREEARKNRKDI